MKKATFFTLAVLAFVTTGRSQTFPCGSASKSGKAYILSRNQMRPQTVNTPYCVRIYITVFADNDGNNRAATDDAIMRQFHQMALSYKPHNICFMLMGIKQVNNSSLSSDLSW